MKPVDSTQHEIHERGQQRSKELAHQWISSKRATAREQQERGPRQKDRCDQLSKSSSRRGGGERKGRRERGRGEEEERGREEEEARQRGRLCFRMQTTRGREALSVVGEQAEQDGQLNWEGVEG